MNTVGRAPIDMAGLRFGKLLVLERTTKPATRSLSPGTGTWWTICCDCGQDVVMAGARLRTGKTLHCGGVAHRRK